MGKCFDDFKNILDKITQRVEEGKINKDGVESTYFGLIAGYLAVIADELHDINETNKEALSNSKEAQKELMAFNREMQNDLRRNKDESKA